MESGKVRLRFAHQNHDSPRPDMIREDRRALIIPTPSSGPFKPIVPNFIRNIYMVISHCSSISMTVHALP